MKTKLLILLIILLGAGAVGSAFAATQDFTLDWYTVAGGGGFSSGGGGYALSGTIGQAAAGDLSGGGYTLQGGFWQASLVEGARLFLPVTFR